MLHALLERDIVPDVIVGTLGRRVQRLGHRAIAEPRAASSGSWRPGSRSGARRCSRAGGCRGRGTCSPATTTSSPTRACATLLEQGDTPPRSRSSWCRCGWWPCDLDTGEEVVFARGPLEPALLASAALPGLFPPIRHDGRTLVDGAVVDTVPLWHALAGPGRPDLRDERRRRAHAPPAAVARSTSPIRAFAISRKQRFELELRSVPESVEVVRAARAGRRPRGLRLLRPPEAHRRGAPPGRAGARRRRASRQAPAPPLRRPWWRRYAGRADSADSVSLHDPARSTLPATGMGSEHEAGVAGPVDEHVPGSDAEHERHRRRSPRSTAPSRGADAAARAGAARRPPRQPAKVTTSDPQVRRSERRRWPRRRSRRTRTRAPRSRPRTPPASR